MKIIIYLLIPLTFEYILTQSTDATCDLTGIFFNQITGKCDQCLPNCLVCLDQSRCYKCENGYFLDSFQQCTKSCEKEGYFANKYDFTCQKCRDQNCLKCSNSKLCDQCIQGFDLNNDKTKCIQKTCDNGGIYIQDKELCSLKQFSCDEYQTYDNSYYGVQSTTIQTQPTESLKYIQKYTTPDNQQILIGIGKTQVYIYSQLDFSLLKIVNIITKIGKYYFNDNYLYFIYDENYYTNPGLGISIYTLDLSNYSINKYGNLATNSFYMSVNSIYLSLVYQTPRQLANQYTQVMFLSNGELFIIRDTAQLNYFVCPFNQVSSSTYDYSKICATNSIFKSEQILFELAVYNSNIIVTKSSNIFKTYSVTWNKNDTTNKLNLNQTANFNISNDIYQVVYYNAKQEYLYIQIAQGKQFIIHLESVQCYKYNFNQQIQHITILKFFKRLFKITFHYSYFPIILNKKGLQIWKNGEIIKEINSSTINYSSDDYIIEVQNSDINIYSFQSEKPMILKSTYQSSLNPVESNKFIFENYIYLSLKGQVERINLNSTTNKNSQLFNYFGGNVNSFEYLEEYKQVLFVPKYQRIIYIFLKEYIIIHTKQVRKKIIGSIQQEIKYQCVSDKYLYLVDKSSYFYQIDILKNELIPKNQLFSESDFNFIQLFNDKVLIIINQNLQTNGIAIINSNNIQNISFSFTQSNSELNKLIIDPDQVKPVDGAFLACFRQPKPKTSTGVAYFFYNFTKIYNENLVVQKEFNQLSTYYLMINSTHYLTYNKLSLQDIMIYNIQTAESFLIVTPKILVLNLIYLKQANILILQPDFSSTVKSNYNYCLLQKQSSLTTTSIVNSQFMTNKFIVYYDLYDFNLQIIDVSKTEDKFTIYQICDSNDKILNVDLVSGTDNILFIRIQDKIKYIFVDLVSLKRRVIENQTIYNIMSLQNGQISYTTRRGLQFVILQFNSQIKEIDFDNKYQFNSNALQQPQLMYQYDSQKINIIDMEEGNFKMFKGDYFVQSAYPRISFLKYSNLIVQYGTNQIIVQDQKNLEMTQNFTIYASKVVKIFDSVKENYFGFTDSTSNITIYDCDQKKVIKTNTTSYDVQYMLWLDGQYSQYFLLTYSYTTILLNQTLSKISEAELSQNLNYLGKFDEYFVAYRTDSQQKFQLIKFLIDPQQLKFVSQFTKLFDFSPNVFTNEQDKILILTTLTQIYIVEMEFFNIIKTFDLTNNKYQFKWISRDLTNKIEVLATYQNPYYYQIAIINYKSFELKLKDVNFPTKIPVNIVVDFKSQLFLIFYRIWNEIYVYDFPNMVYLYRYQRLAINQYLNYVGENPTYYSQILSSLFYQVSPGTQTKVTDSKIAIDLNLINYSEELTFQKNTFIYESQYLYLLNQNIYALIKIDIYSQKSESKLFQSNVSYRDLNGYKLGLYNNNLVIINYDNFIIINKSNLEETQKQTNLQNCIQVLVSKNGEKIFTVTNDSQKIQINVLKLNKQSNKYEFQIIGDVTFVDLYQIEVELIEISQSIIVFKIKNIQQFSYIIYDFIGEQIIDAPNMKDVDISFVPCNNDNRIFSILIPESQIRKVIVYQLSQEAEGQHSLQVLNSISCDSNSKIDILFKANERLYIGLTYNQKIQYLYDAYQIKYFNSSQINYSESKKIFMKPCAYSNQITLEKDYIYTICPYQAIIYSSQSFKYLNAVKTSVFGNSILKNVRYLESDLFLVIYDNKIELYEITKISLNLIQSFNDYYQSELLTYSIKPYNKMKMVEIICMSNFVLFKQQILYSPNIFFNSYQSQKQYKNYEVIINSLVDSQPHCIQQFNQDQTKKQKRYLILVNITSTDVYLQIKIYSNLNLIQIKFYENYIRNSFPVCNQNFFTIDDIIEYTSFSPENYSLLNIPNNKFIQSFFGQMIISNSIIKMTFTDTLNLNVFKKIKYLQFTGIKFLLSKQELKQSLIIDSVDTIIFEEIKIENSEMNFEIKITNATKIIVQNVIISNVIQSKSLSLFTFDKVQTINIQNFTVINSSIPNGIFNINNTNEIKLIDLLVNTTNVSSDLLKINNTNQIIFQNMKYQSEFLNDQIYLLNVWNVIGKLVIDNIEIFYATKTGLLIQNSPKLDVLTEISISNVVFKNLNTDCQPIISFNSTNSLKINGLTILNIATQKIQQNILFFQLSSYVELQNLNFEFKSPQQSQRIVKEIDLLESIGIKQRFIITLSGIRSINLLNININQNNDYGVIIAKQYEIQKNFFITCDNLEIENLNINNSLSTTQNLLNITSHETKLKNIQLINITSEVDIFVFNSLYSLEVLNSIIESIYLKKSSSAFLIKETAVILFISTGFKDIESNLYESPIKIQSVQKVETLVEIQSCSFNDIRNLNQEINSIEQIPIGGTLTIQNIKQFIIKYSQFVNVSNFLSGGAIYLYNVQNSIIESCEFIKCSSSYQSGGVFYISNKDDGNKIEFINNLFENNTALQEKGGAIYASNTQIELKSNKAYNNTSTIGGFLYYDCQNMNITHIINNKNLQNDYQNNKGLFFGNNFGSIPRKIKQINKDSILDSNSIQLSQFQSGSYIKDNVQLQFIDEENNILNYTQVVNSQISKLLQYEKDSYKMFVNNSYSTDLEISSGQQLLLDDEGLFKLNISASYSDKQEFQIDIFTNLSNQFNITIGLDIDFRKCIIGEIIQHRQSQIICMECPLYYYSLTDPNQEDSVECLKCPQQEAESCQADIMILKDGFWRSSKYSDNIFSCENDGCSEKAQENINGCIKGYVGPQCQSCDNNGNIWNDQYALQDKECIKCSNLYSLYFKLIGILLFYIYYIQYSLKTQINNKLNVIKLTYWCKLGIFFFSRSRFHGKDTSILVKIFLNYAQILSLSTKIFSPTILQMKNIFDAYGDPSESTSKKYDCMFNMTENYPVWLNRMLTQIFQIIVSLLIILQIQKIISIKEKKKLYSKIYIIFFYLFYFPSFSKLLISLILCTRIEGKFYLLNDYQQECFTDTHIFYSVFLIYPVTIIWTLVIPVFMLRKMKSNIIEKKTHQIQYILSFYFLQQGYKEDYYYWEILRIFYKLAIMVVLNIFDFDSSCKIIAIICHLYCSFLIKRQPLISHEYMNVEKLLTRILFYTLILQTFVKDEYGEIIKIFALVIIIFMNLYGFLTVFKLYLQIQKFRFIYSEETPLKKKMKQFPIFNQYLNQKVSIFRASKLWRIAYKNLQQATLSRVKQMSAKMQSKMDSKIQAKMSTQISQSEYKQINKSQILSEENLDMQYDPLKTMQIHSPTQLISPRLATSPRQAASHRFTTSPRFTNSPKHLLSSANFKLMLSSQNDSTSYDIK